MSLSRFFAGAFGLVALLGACGSDDRSSFDPSGRPDGFEQGKDAGVGNATCVGTVATAGGPPLDILFLLDRSIWMAGAEWDSATRAIVDFSYQGFPVPTRAALTWYPVSLYRPWDFVHEFECPYGLYETPKVAFGELPQNHLALESALAGANSQWGMGSNLPLFTALKGTYLAASRVQDESPTHQVIVIVLATGNVTACPAYGMGTTSSDQIASLARTALAYNGVRTYTIALSEAGYPLLKLVAEAGEGEAFQPVHTVSGVMDALTQIRQTAVDCAITLPEAPEGRSLDLDAINVVQSSASGAGRRIPAALSSSNCAGGPGWYYDNIGAPTKVILCPATCAPVKTDPNARVDVVLGCKTEVK